jgi:pyruvate dehydrogenase E2 component (dihydrolipoamide acetyltransferase)
VAIEIVMPRLGWTMEVGSVAEWLKKDGDTVKAGDIIFTVESDKAVNEIESFESGVLRIPPNSPAPGESVPIGTVLAYLVQPGESLPSEIATQSSPAISMASTPKNAPESPATDITPIKEAYEDLPTISPRARRVAGELGIDWSQVRGTGRTGRVVERDIRAVAQQATEAAGALRVSPLARRVAEDLNVDLEQLAAAMPGKRIEKAHVEQAAAANGASKRSSPSSETRSPMSSIRRVIATRMANSAHTAAPVTLTTEVDATELVALRKQLKNDATTTDRMIPSYNDLLMKLVAEALIEFPTLNARLEGEDIVQSSAVHIGIAVNSDRGLFVPVVRDVQSKSLRQIALESDTLIQRARSGTLTSAEMSDGTFSISNLGMYDIDAFTPIINLPECAILGIGRIVPKQVVIDADAETVAIRHMLFLSLTFDHRVVDGAPAAQFFQRVKQFVEHPYLGLL